MSGCRIFEAAMSLSFTRQEIRPDLCVIGGGMSGVTAALAAARAGAKVVLIQDRSVLGGNASSEIRMHIVGADSHGLKPGARETGLIEELRLEDAYLNPQRSYSQWDLLLYDKVVAESNITLLLDTHFVSSATKGTDSGFRIQEVTARRPSTQEEFAVAATFFADCSGDGVLGADAGAKYRVGREARSEFAESLANEVADQYTLGSSILFTARHYPAPQAYVAPAWVRQFSRSDFVHRPIQGFEYGYWWFEWGGHLNTIFDNGAIRHELLRIALGVWNYVKNSGDCPDSAHWALDWVGAVPGKRESRRFVGPMTLTQAAVLEGQIFPDTVAYGGWPIDLHPPTGIDAITETPCSQHYFDHLFGIPLRCLHSINVDNLFFAGRNISATHVAFASTRVMATCALMGQAVGTAAAVLSRDLNAGQETIAELTTPARVREIQLELLRSDAFLPGVDPVDPADLAPQAAATASSFEKRHPPENVLLGVTRHLRRAWGPWSQDRLAGWFSSELPATWRLQWAEPRSISRIQLVFDSGLERELTLSASDHTTRRVIRGPQPEIVRDYDLCANGKILMEIRNNFQRLRVHSWGEPIHTCDLEIRVKATHGVAQARIMGCRIYG
jgi:hypothetical protein